MYKLIWLASYPKSGNTWFRVFLTNYLQNSDQPADINNLDDSAIASARGVFDYNYGIDSADLDLNEIDALRPALHDYVTFHSNGNSFHKTHDAYTYLPDNTPLLGKAPGQAALYFIRNPLDVAISFAHHNGQDDLNLIISHMKDSEFSLCGNAKNFTAQMRQQLLTWSEHVLSWAQAPIPKLILRYEDMLTDTLNTFTQAIRFLGLEDDQTRIQRAIKFSSFDILQQQESKAGFGEKAPHATNFFRRGQSGSYKEMFNDEQIQRIIADHRAVMEQFDYI